MLIASFIPILLSWCGSSCRKGAQTPVAAELRNLSTELCPWPSVGLYRLNGAGTGSGLPSQHVCNALDTPLPDTHVCVHSPKTDGIISLGVIWKGRWNDWCNEEYRLRTLCTIVREWRLAARKAATPVWVLDVGANIGTFTLPLLAAGVNVASFEADPTNLELLRGGVAAQQRLATPAVGGMGATTPLGQSIVVGGALSETAGHLLCMSRRNKGNAGSSEVGSATADAACAHHVRTTTLDAAMALLHPSEPLANRHEQRLNVVAMKMDVQGYEAHVFAGASGFLSTSPPRHIFLESPNRSLIEALSSTHGYVHRGGYKDGCDYNVHLELSSAAQLKPTEAETEAETSASRMSPRASAEMAALSSVPSTRAAATMRRGATRHAATRPMTSRGVRGKQPNDLVTTGVATITSSMDAQPRDRGSRPSPAVEVAPTVEVQADGPGCIHGGHDLPSSPLDRAASAPHDAAHEDEQEAGAARVPRVLHQTWKSCQLPERQLAWRERCRRLSPGWDLRLWSDEANRAFVARYYPEELPVFDGYNQTIKRVDAIRYMLLHYYGGLYMDADFACLRDLDTLPIHETAGAATLILQRKSFTDHEAVSNAFMAAPPRHPFFRFVIKQLRRSAKFKHVLDATGPRFLTRAYRAWTQAHPAGERVPAPSDSTGRTSVNYTTVISFAPWALIHRVKSCRPSTIPGPPCHGRYNYHPCKSGKPAELDWCLGRSPNATVTTFWTHIWAPDHLSFAEMAALSAKAKKTASVQTS